MVAQAKLCTFKGYKDLKKVEFEPSVDVNNCLWQIELSFSLEASVPYSELQYYIITMVGSFLRCQLHLLPAK